MYIHIVHSAIAVGRIVALLEAEVIISNAYYVFFVRYFTTFLPTQLSETCVVQWTLIHYSPPKIKLNDMIF